MIQPKFENANQFSEDWPSFSRWKYGFIDRKGNVVNQANFHGREIFLRSGMRENWRRCDDPTGMSSTSNYGEYVFIDKTGEIKIRLKNVECRSFSEGLAAFEKYGDDGFGFIDRTAKVEISPKWEGQAEIFDG